MIASASIVSANTLVLRRPCESEAKEKRLSTLDELGLAVQIFKPSSEIVANFLVE